MIRLAVEEAEAAAAGTADAHDAWEIVARVADALSEGGRRMARQREQVALRIKDQDSLSLRGLADKIGVAPSRAERLINAAKANRR